jgi:hypothetical protein
LVDWGIPDEQAREYEDRITRGEVLVAVTADEDRKIAAKGILEKYGANTVYTSHE